MAGKRKNKADEQLPKRVYRHRNKFVFKPEDKVTITLCSTDEPMSVLWQKYEKKVRELENKETLNALVEQFFESESYRELAPRTQRDYMLNAKQILAVFGSMTPNSIKPQHVRMYMDKRGAQSKTRANRDKAFMSKVFRWAFERGMVRGNPTTGVKQYKESPREKYITDEEYMAIFERAPDTLKVAMELSYLCCARQGDVITMRKDQVRPDGLYIKQGKTGKAQIKAWSPRLVAAIELSSRLPIKPGMASQFIVHKKDGSLFTESGFRWQWRLTREKAKAETGMLLDLTFHDIKAKGISDLDGSASDKQMISGHKTASQVAVYDRKIQIVPTVEGAKTLAGKSSKT